MLLDDNIILVTLSYLSLHLGSKFLSDDLSPMITQLFDNFMLKKLMVFMLGYIYTRSILAALILGTIYIILFHIFFNEKSSISLIKKDVKDISSN